MINEIVPINSHTIYNYIDFPLLFRFILKHPLLKSILKYSKVNNFVVLVGYYFFLNNVRIFCKKYNFLQIIKSRIKSQIKKIPLVQKKIEEGKSLITDEIKKEFEEEVKSLNKVRILSEEGWHEERIIEEFNTMKHLATYDFKKGRVSGAVYSNNGKLDKLLHKIFPYFNKSNPLHTNVFPAIRKMENDIVRIMINMFNGDENVVGSFTSGGTESILLACKTYRNLNPQIEKPNIIVSSTAHCAFNKACKYFKIELRMVQCLKDGTFDLQALEKTIDKSTVLIVGSAPSYNLGIIDPIEELSDFCLNKEIPLHVDCCLGAFLINFTDLKFDFRLFGVTSISADLHKYGNTPKGASTVLYRNKDIMRCQYFIDENWSGGVYATTTIAGSKCGNIIALSWATLMYNGINHYKNNYHKIMEVREYFVEKLEDVKEIIIYGKPELNVVAMGSKEINMNILGEKLKDKGWDINMIQNPGGFHFCVTSYHTKEVIDEFFADLNELVPEIPHSTTDSKCIYGTMKSLNDNEIIQDVITEYLHILNSPI